jgi:FecCD transport family
MRSGYSGRTAATLMAIDREYSEELFIWQTGSLMQNGNAVAYALAPWPLAGAAAAFLLVRPFLQLLDLGDERATGLGATPTVIRLAALSAGVMLAGRGSGRALLAGLDPSSRGACLTAAPLLPPRAQSHCPEGESTSSTKVQRSARHARCRCWTAFPASGMAVKMRMFLSTAAGAQTSHPQSPPPCAGLLEALGAAA